MHHLNELEELFHHFFHWNRARIRCIVPLIIGMIQLGTVNLSKIADEIVSRIADGQVLPTITKELKISLQNVYDWL